MNDKNTFKIYLWIISGMIIVTALVSSFVFRTPFFWQLQWARGFLSICIIAYLFYSITSFNIKRIFINEQIGLVLFIGLIVLSVVLTLIAFLRIYYSRSFLLLFFSISAFWITIGLYLFCNPRTFHFLICPWGVGLDLIDTKGRNWKSVDDNKIIKKCDGIIVDFHEKIDSDWMRFISNLSLTSIPIYHAANIYERINRRISLYHLNEGIISSFKVNKVYFFTKRITEVIIILAFSPLIILMVLIVSLLVKLNSKGPIFFLQQRMGRNGQKFMMFKFRTMSVRSDESKDENFTSDEDSRVTKIGTWLRKYRIDEIPQFLNILIGNMSLIGPRPEQIGFSRNYETEIPFYAYRNLIRPGITGWAQVNKGYTSTTDDTRDKLSYDLYYLKNMSLRLDFLIIIKTIRTILTGFGAR